ncbi:Protein timeless like protein [Eufriesea mexicana]|uniref:Protein timeless like protein n=1 Tax=Eufriesea mexicana TaxID=516756 RepID=A0A310SQR9_9HYME|nr:Protein timeless like protein [Eufriesea mexicana]
MAVIACDHRSVSGLQHSPVPTPDTLSSTINLANKGDQNSKLKILYENLIISQQLSRDEALIRFRGCWMAPAVVEEDPVTQSGTQQEENIENILDDVPEEEDEEEERAAEPYSTVAETDFKFSDFIHRFANVKIVKAMLILLQQFDKNTDEVNHYVNKMLHRIAWDCKMPGMMFQASMFRVFQRILESKYYGHKELQKFAVFIIRRFIEVAQKNRKAYMELLFWKTSRDASDVVEGYNAETDSRKLSHKLWTETQEDELRTLFMEHQTNNYSQDIVSWILQNINQERTRRGVIKKLKEMCLIVNSKPCTQYIYCCTAWMWMSSTRRGQLGKLELPLFLSVPNPLRDTEHLGGNKAQIVVVITLYFTIMMWVCAIANPSFQAVRSEVQKRLPKEWSEDEVSQLTELWQELKDDDDPVDLIFNGLTIKRPKPKIKEKLLELGLAKDRKELRKKRSRKSNHGKSSWETQSASNSDEDEGSDEEAGKSSSNKNTAPNKPRNKGAKKNAKKQPTMVYTDAQLSGLLRDVIEKNMSPALEWIKESLQDVLDDQDEESSEGIPLVPLTDYSSAAMDSPSFQKLIRAMGFAPPADEQESYWRIPANMLSSMIQKRCNLIEAALEGNFIEEVTPKAPAKLQSDNDESIGSEDEDVLANIRKYFTSKAEPQPSTSRESDTEAIIHSTPKPLKSSTVTSTSIEHVDTEVEEAETRNPQTVEISKSEGRKSGRRINLLADSSDSELEIEINTNNAEDEGKRHRSEESDENETVKKRRLVDSDEEKEPSTSMDTEMKRTKTIISDDEEEVTQEQRKQQRSSRAIISDDED